MSGSSKMDGWSKWETAGFIYFSSRWFTKLGDVAQFMERKCQQGTTRPVKELETRLEAIGKTKAYDLKTGGRWNQDEADILIHKLVGKDTVKTFFSKMKMTEDDIRVLRAKGYTLDVTSGEATLSTTATVGGFGMSQMSMTLPQMTSTIPATSGSGSMWTVPPKHDASDEDPPRPRKRVANVQARPTQAEEEPLQPRTRVLDTRAPSVPNQEQAKLSTNQTEYLDPKDYQIAVKWSKGEDLDEASNEHWALTLGHQERFGWAWRSRKKLNEQLHSTSKKWNYLEEQELRYWRAQDDSSATFNSKFEHHTGTGPQRYYTIHFSGRPEYQWVERVRLLNRARKAKEAKGDQAQLKMKTYDPSEGLEQGGY